jgi:hypothetical protein
MIVDALFQLVEHGETMGGGKMYFRLHDGIDRARLRQWMY